MEKPVIFEGKFHYRINGCVIALVGVMAMGAGGLKLIYWLLTADNTDFDLKTKLIFLGIIILPVLLVLLGVALHARKFMKQKLLLLSDSILWTFPNSSAGQLGEIRIPLNAVQEIYAASDRRLIITANGLQYAVDGLSDAYAFELAVHSRVRALVQAQENAAAAAAAAKTNPAAVSPVPAAKPLPEAKQEPAAQTAASPAAAKPDTDTNQTGTSAGQ